MRNLCPSTIDLLQFNPNNIKVVGIAEYNGVHPGLDGFA